MHLAIDAVGAKHSGGAVVFAELVRVAVASPRIERLTLFTSPRPLRNYDLPTGPHVAEYAVPQAEGSLARRVAWYERGLGDAAREAGADVLLCMSGMGRGRRVPHVTFLQQSLPFSAEALERMPVADRVRFAVVRAMMGRSVRSAAAVFCQTPTMVRWISDAFGVPADGMSWYMPVPRDLPVVPSRPPAAVAPMLAVPRGDRLLYVGNTSGYKNVDTAIAAVARMRRDRPGATLFLTWPKDHPAKDAPGVVCLGYLDPVALAAAYDAADVLLQTSLVESGPLTMNEAMTRGTPVLCADRPYGHDLCEDAAVYFDPLSPEELASKALRLLNDADARHALAEAGRRLIAQRRQESPYDRMIETLAGVLRTGVRRP